MKPLSTVQLFIAMLIVFSAHASAQTGNCSSWAAKLESLEGNGSVKRGGESEWVGVTPGATFCYGDTLRVTEFRAALRLENDSLVRINEGSIIKFLPPKESFWVEVLNGAAHFLSRTPKKFTVKAPYMNAAVEGTEFIVSHNDNGDTVTVFEGQVLASNAQGKIRLQALQQSSALPNEAPTKAISINLRETAAWTLYAPPLYVPSDQLAQDIQQAINTGAIGKALSLLDASALKSDLNALNAYTTLALFRGRLTDARIKNQQALAQNKASADALANSAFMYLLDGKAGLALEKTHNLVKQHPESINAQLVHSYALQANFQLEQALAAAQIAQRLNANVVTNTRIAELALSLGKSRLASDTLAKTKTNPLYAPYADSLRALIALQNNSNRKARAILQKSVTNNPNVPLTHFVLGLTHIRLNKLQEGRAGIELAVTLDPSNSLYRSYLGKAFAAQNKGEKAKEQFELAKILDPNDPTPWFYQALEQQANNQLIESQHNYNKSRALNDGRAVYRSRLLLDKDDAARTSSQGRALKALGFEQQAIQLGAEAVQQAPGEHAGHRLLAEVYANDYHRELLRSSERLQATIHQPLGAVPLPLGLSESGMVITEGAGPADLGANEYNSMYLDEGFGLQAKVLGGTQGTGAYDVAVNGNRETLAFSLGQYRYKSDGYRENNDVDYKISNAFVQWQPTQNLGFQAELGQRDDNIGDLTTEFGANTHSTTSRVVGESETQRVSMKYQSDSGTYLVLNVTDKDESNVAEDTLALPGLTIEISNDEKINSSQYELQLVHEFRHTTLSGGLKSSESKSTGASSLYYVEFDALDSAETSSKNSLEQAYLYSDITALNNSLIVTLGAEHNSAEHAVQVGVDGQPIENKNDKTIYPKMGVAWDITPKIKLRTAYFTTISMVPKISGSLNSTHIAGAAQVYDHFDVGTTSSNKTLGVNIAASDRAKIGLDILKQNITLPNNTGLQFVDSDMQYDLVSAHFDYLLTEKLSTHIKLSTEEVDRDQISNEPLPLFPLTLQNNSLNIGLSYQLTRHSFIKIEGKHINQQYSTESIPDLFIDSEDFSERLNIIDASIQANLPNRLGKVTLLAKNLLDTEFTYADLELMYSTPSRQELTPERTLLVKFEINI
ncbi:FecR domain-containing protein [Teredinibacter franksiae]|uniref:FecR domain-containing protein n=1 Tax=Teredinibacter franksiae TaxID=2761453 RepID=UPI0016276B66|nr:FecR domain-containing protein [Teredinibacter franksiae]